MGLTGKFQFRKTLWGKTVLQIEEEVKPFWSRSQPDTRKRRWRDATLMDLAAPEMRTLIDMRFRPHLRSQSSFAPETTSAQRERNEVPAEIVCRAEQNQATGRRKLRPLRRPLADAVAQRKSRDEKPLRPVCGSHNQRSSPLIR